MPTSNKDELTKAKMYAIVDDKHDEVMEIQGKAALSEAENPYDDYCRADEKALYDYYIENVWRGEFPAEFVVDEGNQ